MYGKSLTVIADDKNKTDTSKALGGINIPPGMEDACTKKHLNARIQYLLDHEMFKSQELIRLIKHRDKLSDNLET